MTSMEPFRSNMVADSNLPFNYKTYNFPQKSYLNFLMKLETFNFAECEKNKCKFVATNIFEYFDHQKACDETMNGLKECDFCDAWIFNDKESILRHIYVCHLFLSTPEKIMALHDEIQQQEKKELSVFHRQILVTHCNVSLAKFNYIKCYQLNCFYVTCSHILASLHIRTCKPKLNPTEGFKCCRCGGVFEKQQHCLHHRNLCHGMQPTLETRKPFTSPINILMKKMCRYLADYNCLKCPSNGCFYIHGDLKKILDHFSMCAKGLKETTFDCRFCPLKFETSEFLQKHVRNHHLCSERERSNRLQDIIQRMFTKEDTRIWKQLIDNRSQEIITIDDSPEEEDDEVIFFCNDNDDVCVVENSASPIEMFDDGIINISSSEHSDHADIPQDPDSESDSDYCDFRGFSVIDISTSSSKRKIFLASQKDNIENSTHPPAPEGSPIEENVSSGSFTCTTNLNEIDSCERSKMKRRGSRSNRLSSEHTPSTGGGRKRKRAPSKTENESSEDNSQEADDDFTSQSLSASNLASVGPCMINANQRCDDSSQSDPPNESETNDGAEEGEQRGSLERPGKLSLRPRKSKEESKPTPPARRGRKPKSMGGAVVRTPRTREVKMEVEVDMDSNDPGAVVLPPGPSKRKSHDASFESDRIDSTTHLANPSMMVECAICAEKMPAIAFKQVHVFHHNFLCWVKGDDPLPLDNIAATERFLNRQKAKFPYFRFKCELCAFEPKSTRGLLSHRLFCGKTGKE